MNRKSVTLTSIGTNGMLAGTRCFAQVAGGPRVELHVADYGEIRQFAEEFLDRLPKITPRPDGNEDELLVLPLSGGIQRLLPKQCFAIVDENGTRELPGPLGALCIAVGGLDRLADMTEVAPQHLEEWCKVGVPAGPARPLLRRIADQYGVRLNLA